MKDIKRIGEQLLPVIAYGDATGLPYEHMHSADIDVVTGLRDTSPNTHIGEHKAGTWSDDTHLSLVVMRSLTAREGFDLEDIADGHVRAYQHARGESDDLDLGCPIQSPTEPIGWGKSTIASVERLARGVHSTESGELDGAGNGALMKLAPLVLWQYARGYGSRQSAHEVEALTALTHRNRTALIASEVHRTFLISLLKADEREAADDTFLPNLISQSHKRAKLLEGSIEDLDTSKVLGRFVLASKEFEIQPDVVVEATPGGGFYAPETLGRVYGSFCIENRFPDSVYRAVELGGDTDTIASMVGAMSLFLHGEVAPPTDIRKLFAIKRLQRISREFTRTILPD